MKAKIFLEFFVNKNGTDKNFLNFYWALLKNKNYENERSSKFLPFF